MRPIFCPNSMCKTSNNNKLCRRWRKTTSDKTSNSLSIAHSNSYFFVAYRKTAVTLFKKKLVCYFIVCALNGALNLRENYISCFVCCSFIALQEKFKLLLEWSQCQSAFVHTQIERERDRSLWKRRERHTRNEKAAAKSRVRFSSTHWPKMFYGISIFFSLSRQILARSATLAHAELQSKYNIAFVTRSHTYSFFLTSSEPSTSK